MAVTTLASGAVVRRWSLKYFKEYVRKERFARYTGEDPNNVFQIVRDLQKNSGDNVTLSLITRLTSSGSASISPSTLRCSGGASIPNSISGSTR